MRVVLSFIALFALTLPAFAAQSPYATGEHPVGEYPADAPKASYFQGRFASASAPYSCWDCAMGAATGIGGGGGGTK